MSLIPQTGLDETLAGWSIPSPRTLGAMTSPPLVSICMTVYEGNTQEEVLRALQSIVRQDYPALEVILVLDGPVSIAVMTGIEGVQQTRVGNVRVISPGKKIGRVSALNLAIASAEGAFLALMDADDESLGGRIETQVEFLLAHPDADVVGCAVEEVFGDGFTHVVRAPLTHQDCVREFRRRDPVYHPTAMFRRRFFDKVGRYPSAPEQCDDMALWLAGMRSGCQFANLDLPLYRMFLDDRFLARRGNPKWAWQVFRFRLRIARELGYGLKSYLWATLRLAVMLFPRGLLERTYRIRGLIWKYV